MKRTATLREIRDSSPEELRGRLSRLEGELFRLRLKKTTNQLEDIMQIRSTRREIARVMTVLAEKQAASATPRSE
jgi:large subunit ribosomal protein L29